MLSTEMVALVPALVPDLRRAKTLRDLLENHRSDSAGIECHRQIDPVVRIAEYSKGRKLVATDYPMVEAIITTVEKEDFKLKTIVHQIANSDLTTRK